MTNTPVPQGYKLTVSFSRLDNYDGCPFREYHERIAKTVPFIQKDYLIWGNEVHKALEDAAVKGTPLPSNMVQYQPSLDKVKRLAEIADEAQFEKKMAQTVDNKPCGWRDKDAFLRGTADYFMRIGDQGFLGDWKTGKPHNSKYGPNLQPTVMAKMKFDHHPEIQEITSSWVYLAHQQTDTDHFTRDTIEERFAPVQKIIEDYQRSIEHENFPMRPSGLCRAHCDVFGCPNNGRSGPDD